MHPSHALYQALQTAYEHFNRELFEDALPEVIFTVQRQNDVLGYFAPERWVSPEGERCHEIAINPAHMGQSRVIDVLQTLAHEMVHCWQYCFGNPSRRSYHNKEWAKKMIAIGLQPSSTGAPGGEITGQHMSDYPVAGGVFLQSCESLVRNKAFRLPWIYRLALPSTLMLGPTDNPTPQHDVFPEPGQPEPLVQHWDLAVTTDDVSSPLEPLPESFLYSTYQDVLPEGTFVIPPQPPRSKVKYLCSGCHIAVWGKPGIRLICGDCNLKLETMS